jgi:hypothetical protein
MTKIEIDLEDLLDIINTGSLSQRKRTFNQELLSLQKGEKKLVKRKAKQSPKQKLLTKMTAAKWNKYKKGRGKKTYVEIRAAVSRSQAFKKKAKRL